jgi:hypothetical protein
MWECLQYNMDMMNMSPSSDISMQPLNTVCIKEEKTFIISNVRGGAEFLGAVVDHQLCAVADAVMKKS